MRSAIFVGFLLAAAACGPKPGGTTTTNNPTGQAGGVPGYPATRWVPAKPTYVVAAPSVTEFQRATRDVIESFGLPTGVGAAAIGAAIAQVIGVDPLSAEALASVGVDVANGVTLFSEDVSPTIAIKLSKPELFAQFLAKARGQGMVPQTVKVDGVDMSTTALGSELHISWAIVDDWLLVHVTLDFLHDNGTDWLAHARAGGQAWQPSWEWAAKAGAKVAANAPALVGYGDVGAILQTIGQRAPDAMACAKALAPIGRVALAVGGDDHHTTGRVAFDLGDAAKSVDAALLPEPTGWGAVASGAPLALEWNLDIATMLSWFAPCAHVMGDPEELHQVSKLGFRAMRAVLQKYDAADEKNSKGAIALDLTSAKFVTDQLDQVPLRTHLERDRTYGSYKGHYLSVPGVGHLDYVITEHMALIGVGEGVLDKLTTSPPGHPPVLAIDVVPGAMSREAWEAALGNFAGKDHAHAIATALQLWKDAHVAIAIDGDNLVFEASGNRR